MIQDNNTNSSAGVDDGYTFRANRHVKFVVIAIAIVLVNTFVILLFASKRNLRKSPNFLLISLSFSDLLTGCVGLPLVLVCTTTPSCIACILSNPFIIFTSISTVLHILVITYERFVKIVFPFKRKFSDTKVELRSIAMVWVISFVFSVVPLTWSELSEDACHGPEDDARKRRNRIYSILQLIIFVALPLFLITVADISVFVVVRRQLERIQGTSLANDHNARDRMKKERKVVVVMATMMVYFVICWSFYYSVLFMYTLSPHDYRYIPDWVWNTFEVLRSTTSLVNPILYVLLKHDFRQTLAGELRRLLCARRRHLPIINVHYTAKDGNGAGALAGQNTESMYLNSPTNPTREERKEKRSSSSEMQ